MPMPIHSHNSRTVLTVRSITVFALLTLALFAAMRPIERVAHIQTPDDTHVHQVYAKNPLNIQFTASAQGLSGISIVRRQSTIAESKIITHIYDSKNTEIKSSTNISQTEIRILFTPQAQSRNKQFTISIETLDTNKQHALLLPYESDSTKHPNTIVWQNDIRKQGSLGITEYEKPTIALMIARWLTLPHQKTLWVGVGLCVIGLSFRPPSLPVRQAGRNPGRRGSRVKPGMTIYYVLIFLAILIVYWPATKLFFYSDDVPILARTEILKTTNPLLLFTPYQYQESDQRSNFGFDFWRPVSFGAFPLMLSFLPGPPNAQVYYFINNILFAITGCLLFAIAKHILKSSAFAFIATAIWAFHSTKLGVVYWWSSSQDILASLFAMGAIALHIKGKNKLALTLYMLGMLSKEYVIITPIIIAGIDLLDKKSLAHILHKLCGFGIATGVFLIINTAMLGNPWTYKNTHANTYTFSVHPASIVQNTLIYASASAESRFWPSTAVSNSLERVLNNNLELWRAKTSGPYYPGAVLIALWLSCILIFFRTTAVRNTIIFGGLWWAIYLGPILLFANDWKPRWLMLSMFGIGLLIAVLCKHMRLPNIAAYIITALLLVYGFQTARADDLTRFYREQSQYTRSAYNQLQAQQKNIQTVDHIILVGISEEQQTSLNAYLFRVYAKNPQADIMYAEALPKIREPSDVIINMSDIHPYYPESEK